MAERLRREPGISQVFFDTRQIPAGADFWARIERDLTRCDVCFVMIGSGWRGASEGQARIFGEGDFVRKEVATALRTERRIVPVLIDGAPMPTADQLPEDLHGLLKLSAVVFRQDVFDDDVVRLANAALNRTRSGVRRSIWQSLGLSLVGFLVAAAALLISAKVLHDNGRPLSLLLGGNLAASLAIAVVLICGIVLPHLLMRRSG